MIFKKSAYFILVVVSILLLGCGKDEPSLKSCDIQGSINGFVAKTGVKVSLQNVANPSLVYIAYSNVDGEFEFQNVKEGDYYITASKDSYSINWITFEGNYIRDNAITVKGDAVKNIVIYMSKNQGGSSNSQLQLTTLSGQSVSNVIKIPRFTSSIGFRIYNGTDTPRNWEISNPSFCYVYSSDSFFLESIFSSIAPLGGQLRPGESVELIGYFNQAIYNYTPHYPDHPGTLSAKSTITFYLSTLSSEMITKEIKLDIEFL